MKLSDFDFDLPLDLIAQKPTDQRDHSKLLVVHQEQDLVATNFYNIIDYLQSGDVLVFNNSRVIKAKLILHKDGRKIDFYLHKRVSDNCWRGFAKPSKKLVEKDEFAFGNHKIIISKKLAMGETEVLFELDNISVFEFLDIYGQMPLPPYIKRSDADLIDESRYQTVYGSSLGSVAAPTAGLHFTEELLHKIKQKGVKMVHVTLHVGAGTFLPVKTEDINEHKMHSEYYNIDQQTANIINDAKKTGRRIIAVGTTSVRALESSAKNQMVVAGEFETTIFIKPSFKFQIIDLLITNFHLPRSTLFILVCAFAGHWNMLNAYKYAINQRMRFFSYGDAMLLYPSNSIYKSL